MSLRNRLLLSIPGMKELIIILDALIAAVNKLSEVVFTGENPHKANDSTNVVTAADADDLDSVIDLERDLGVKYAAHIAATAAHIAADTTNTLTATTVYAKVKALADELKADYNLHRVRTTSSCHAGGGDGNAVTAADVSSKATAITLLNQIKAMFNLHLANVTSCHGAADTTNVVATADLTSGATWTQIQVMVDAIRTAYEAHRQLTAGSVHGSADATNTISASAVGAPQTSVNTFLTELKGDLNAHILLLTSHYVKDDSMAVTAADATTLATSIALSRAIKTSYNNHISRATESALTVPTLDSL